MDEQRETPHPTTPFSPSLLDPDQPCPHVLFVSKTGVSHRNSPYELDLPSQSLGPVHAPPPLSSVSLNPHPIAISPPRPDLGPGQSPSGTPRLSEPPATPRRNSPCHVRSCRGFRECGWKGPEVAGWCEARPCSMVGPFSLLYLLSIARGFALFEN